MSDLNSSLGNCYSEFPKVKNYINKEKTMEKEKKMKVRKRMNEITNWLKPKRKKEQKGRRKRMKNHER